MAVFKARFRMLLVTIAGQVRARLHFQIVADRPDPQSV